MTHICHFCRRELSDKALMWTMVYGSWYRVTETVKKCGSLISMEIKPVGATACRIG